MGLGATTSAAAWTSKARAPSSTRRSTPGITFLDTADIYGGGGAERFVGEVLEGRRDRVVLATKFGMDMGDGATEPRGSRAYLRRAIDASLARLRTDRIDLLYYHGRTA